jgi:2-polyprenyl-3-methyl-5-hydroxy-6-metoxy-1,4-benzoquinol methylase
MKGPVQWFRGKLSQFVEVRIFGAVERENLAGLRDDVAGSYSALSELRDECRTHARIQSEIQTDLQSFRKQVSEDQRIPAIEKIMPDVISRLNSIDSQAQAASAMTRDVGARLDLQSAEIGQLSSRIRANPFQNSPLKISSTRDGSETMGFDSAGAGKYVDFVEAFRPSFDELLSQLSYLRTWLPTSGNAVDFGAGRGEMVQMMSDHGLFSYGIDSDQSVVLSAAERGIDVRLSDVDSFLNGCALSSLDVVTAIQVVEHVNTDQLVSWLEKIRGVLKSGGVFIAETPNPHAIDAFKAFWVDVTHVRPYYPESLLHMAQSAGFSRAEIWAPGEEHDITSRLEFAGSYTLIATV